MVRSFLCGHATYVQALIVEPFYFSATQCPKLEFANIASIMYWFQQTVFYAAH